MPYLDPADQAAANRRYRKRLQEGSVIPQSIRLAELRSERALAESVKDRRALTREIRQLARALKRERREQSA